MRLPGLSFCEVLSGNYWRMDAPIQERAIRVNLLVATLDVATLVRTQSWTLSGTVVAEGFARERPLEGSISLRLLEERRIPYRFAFFGDDGARYEFAGEKEWNGLAPIASMTLLPASVYNDEGDEFARATLRFDLRADWWPWLKSIRVK